MNEETKNQEQIYILASKGVSKKETGLKPHYMCARRQHLRKLIADCQDPVSCVGSRWLQVKKVSEARIVWAMIDRNHIIHV